MLVSQAFWLVKSFHKALLDIIAAHNVLFSWKAKATQSEFVMRAGDMLYVVVSPASPFYGRCRAIHTAVVLFVRHLRSNWRSGSHERRAFRYVVR